MLKMYINLRFIGKEYCHQFIPLLSLFFLFTFMSVLLFVSLLSDVLLLDLPILTQYKVLFSKRNPYMYILTVTEIKK